MELSNGDLVVVHGSGLFVVQEQVVHDGSASVRLSRPSAGGETMVVPLQRSAELLRQVVERGEAVRLYTLLSDPQGPVDERPLAYQLRDAAKALGQGTLGSQVRALGFRYRSPYALTFAERRMIDRLELTVLSELAQALGLEAGELINNLHAAAPVFAPGPRPAAPALQRPVAPVDVPGHDYLGLFAIEGEAALVGDATCLATNARSMVQVAASNGRWHAFVRREADHNAGGLVAVHEDHLLVLADLEAKASERGTCEVESGAVGILDAAARGNPAVVDESLFPLQRAGLLEGRGCHCGSGGDGGFLVRADGAQARLVMVDF